jgi:DNA-binding transcriptional LysR family regulator
MTLDQLRVFIAVAERGHVTHAATSLGITQSAASAAIAVLETRYHAKLFDRVGRGIQLTETGRRFLHEARGVVDRASVAKCVLEELAGGITGTVLIAASQTIASYWLPRRLTSFRFANPGVRLNVVIHNTREVESAVVEGRAHLGLVEGPTQHPALTRVQIDTDHPVLVVAANAPPLPRNARGGIELHAIQWVIREAGSGTRHVLEELVRREGLSLEDLNIFLVLPDNEAIREAVEAGAGATIISEHVVTSAIASGKLRANPIDLPPRDFVIVQHRNRHTSTAQLSLVNHLIAAHDTKDGESFP